MIKTLKYHVQLMTSTKHVCVNHQNYMKTMLTSLAEHKAPAAADFRVNNYIEIESVFGICYFIYRFIFVAPFCRGSVPYSNTLVRCDHCNVNIIIIVISTVRQLIQKSSKICLTL